MRAKVRRSWLLQVGNLFGRAEVPADARRLRRKPASNSEATSAGVTGTVGDAAGRRLDLDHRLQPEQPARAVAHGSARLLAALGSEPGDLRARPLGADREGCGVARDEHSDGRRGSLSLPRRRGKVVTRTADGGWRGPRCARSAEFIELSLVTRPCTSSVDHHRRRSRRSCRDSRPAPASLRRPPLSAPKPMPRRALRQLLPALGTHRLARFGAAQRARCGGRAGKCGSRGRS